MAVIRKTARDDTLVVKRVGDTVWILRPTRALETRIVGVLRDAFLEAVDSGAQQVVVDLSDVDTIAGDGAATLVVMADHMLGRNGGLWLAAPWPDGAGYTLRAIEELGPQALLGVTPALDAALEELSCEEETAAELPVR